MASSIIPPSFSLLSLLHFLSPFLLTSLTPSPPFLPYSPHFLPFLSLPFPVRPLWLLFYFFLPFFPLFLPWRHISLVFQQFAENEDRNRKATYMFIVLLLLSSVIIFFYHQLRFNVERRKIHTTCKLLNNIFNLVPFYQLKYIFMVTSMIVSKCTGRGWR